MDSNSELIQAENKKKNPNLIKSQILGQLVETISIDIANKFKKSKHEFGIFRYIRYYYLQLNWFWVGMWALLVAVLIFSRVVGWDWGLPYPMHPDERNMAVAIMNLKCENLPLPPLTANPFNFINQLPATFKDCWNPKFFAYGQFPLYLGKILLTIRFPQAETTTYLQAVWSLRMISIISSIFTFLISVIFVKRLMGKYWHKSWGWISAWLFVFVPYGIQFSHFGTTESLMMFCYTFITYLSFVISQSRNPFSSRCMSMLALATIVAGVAVASKVSSLLFLPIILIALAKSILAHKGFFATKFIAYTFQSFMVIVGVLILSFVFSPHNFFSWTEFVGTINYESSIGVGTSKAFYTRQFEYTLPILFQIRHILPYVFGLGQFGVFLMSLILISGSWIYWFLITAIALFFVPSAYLYAKWTRFIAPIFPIMSIIIVFALSKQMSHIHSKIYESQRTRHWVRRYFTNILLILVVIFLSLPGIAYLKIYQSPDVRYIASKWLFENLKENDVILSETANVVDMPIGSNLTENLTLAKGINYISFPSYDVDVLPDLQSKLTTYLGEANWIFIPSRRVVANHTCWNYKNESNLGKISDWSFDASRCENYEKSYPVVNQYYQNLYSGVLPFEKIAEFSSYPRIELFGKTIYQIDDERAEETWTVFDHPVVRFYKRKN